MKALEQLYNSVKTNNGALEVFAKMPFDGIIYYDLITPACTWLNKKLLTTLGYNIEDKIEVTDIVNTDTFVSFINTVITDLTSSHELVLLNKNGKKIWLQAHAVLFENDKKLLITLSNITASKEREQLLVECNKQANIGYWSAEYLEEPKLIWGIVTKQIHEVDESYIPSFDTAFAFYKPGINATKLADSYNKAIVENLTYNLELEIITAKGNEKWVRCIGIPEIVDGRCLRVFGTFQDITNEKLLSQQLIDEKIKLENAIQATQLATWIWDMHSDKLTYNNRWAEIIGYTIEELSPIQSDTWSKLTHPDDLPIVAKQLEACFNRTVDYYNAEYRMKHKAGHWVWVYDRGKVHSWTEDGKPLLMSGTHLEITKQKNKVEQYLEFIKNAPSSIAMFDADMRYLAASNKWIKDNKINSFEELLGRSQLEFNVYSDEDWRKTYLECLTGKSKSNDECFVSLGNGICRWLKWVINPWYNLDGEVGGLIMMTEDITEKIESEELLRVSEATFRGNFLHAGVGMGISDKNGIGLKANPKLCEMLGYTEEELINTPFVALTHPDDVDLDVKLFNEVAEGKRNSYQIEKRCFHKNGDIVYIILVLSTVNDKNGDILYYITQMIDITQQKIAELKLEQALSHTQTILDASTQVSIIETDLNGTIITFNKGAENLLGYKAEDVLHKLNVTELHDADELDNHAEIIFNKTGVKPVGFNVFVNQVDGTSQMVSEWNYIDKSGKQFPVLLTISPVRQDEKIVGYLGIGVNITEIKKVEAKIKELLKSSEEQNTRLRNFAHIVSHNLRSHSGNISALIDIIQAEQAGLSENIVFTYLKSAANSLKETIDHLHTVASVNANISDKLSPLNIKTVIEAAISNVTGLALENEVDIQNLINTDCNIYGDLIYVESIVLNLLTNAIKYKSNDRKSSLIISAKNTEEFIEVSFKDNGLGIDLNKHNDKLFGMYKTFHNHPDARGVGLFITKNQIEALGGRIEVESEVNVGTTFKLFFKKSVDLF
ncbi:MAG: PAS domain S-box protein [Bacteroidia bacterium]|nr:PAS domain S-box protein [Bacteroidia bacterium]